MNAERWRRIDEIFALVQELDDAEAARVLDEQCANDAELRREVESMRALARDAESFLETPAITEVQWREEREARFLPGDLVANRYRIADLLGRGGMGEVYRADDLKLGQTVALKFLAESLAANGAALARFHREVSLARQVSHRHVCRVYDIGEHAGMHFLSMEYVRGEELASLLRRVGRLPDEKAYVFARQLCAGLAAIHAAGIVHRDLKPSNVMLDESGDVRITDFGIAALSDADRASETMIGTPAYMAPEQLTHGQATTRSDIYALGLVLHEAFTGKRRTSESQDGDPIILRCLDPDPGRRPASALEVSAALPGGDPLAAALAAGETPSPQMVAAASNEGRFAPRNAVLLLVWILAALAATAILSDRLSLHRFLSLRRSPELLRADAEEIASDAGYAGRDFASGFRRQLAVIDYVAARTEADRWTRFRDAPLPAFYFWYRLSPRPLLPYSSWRVDADDPPNLAAGMMRLRLDPQGRLLYFEGVPSAQHARADWPRFFERAGFAISAFRPTASRATPPQQSDAQFAWIGAHPSWPDLPLRIEAASHRGAPVYFEVIWPWRSLDRMPPLAASGDPFTIVLLVFYFGALSLAAFLAWRNFRKGRGDRRGTLRLMLFIFALRVVFWIFVAHHIFTIDELGLVISGLEAAVYWSAVVGLLYLALEPLIRRRLPHVLISWSRLLSGDARDPLVGRDILIGGAFGMVIVLTIHAFHFVPRLLGNSMRAPAIHSPLLHEYGLDGWRGFVPLVVNQITASIMFPLIIASAVMFFIMLTRRNAIGIGISWLIFYFALFLNFGDRNSPISFVIALVLPSVLLFVLTRYGLLALIATFFYIHVWPFYPATTELTAWYATTYILQLILLIAIASWAFRVSLAGQRVFSGSFLEA
jgi:serine/threonine-protein kinase